MVIFVNNRSEYSRALNASYTFQPLMSFWLGLITVNLIYTSLVLLFGIILMKI